MGYSSEQEIEISGPPQWIVACIFIALAGLVLPLLLIPVVKTLGYSEIIEEIAKAVVVLIIVLKIPRLKSKIMTSVVFGFLFGFSENVFYLNQLMQNGLSQIFIERFLITVPMHVVTVLVVLGFTLQKRYLWLVGLLLAITFHLLFNFLV